MDSIGSKIYCLADRLFPICRSITGNGVRETLEIIKEYIPEMKIFEVPTGTTVFDWTIPKEWNLSEGYIENDSCQRIIDSKNNNLHIMGYSIPVDRWVDLEELKKYIYTQPAQPDVIPYVTSYYTERFGFCMSENQKFSLPEGNYHMVIESELKEGSLTYGEVILKGDTDKEVFFSTYICHPSMANNECSGPALATYLIDWLKHIKNRKYTYRFVFIPETIGSITYLSLNLKYLKEHIVAGFNLSCVGDNYDYSIVESRYGKTLADKVLKNTLNFHTTSYTTYSFLKRGSDERQYNAPGVNLPVVGFCRSKYGEFPEYHTSADDMDFISPEGFEGSMSILTNVVYALEYNANYQVSVLCEPQLGKRGLYPTVSQKGSYDEIASMTDLIAYADGKNDLIDISDIIGVSVKDLIPIVQKLKENHLIS